VTATALPGFEALRDAYATARQAPGALRPPGKPLIGVIGAAPLELVAAAGAHAVNLARPPYGPTPAADRYMDDIIPTDAHAFFQAAHDGLYSGFDLLVLSRGHDKLFYYLKEALRIGDGAAFPPLHMFDLMESRRTAVEAYNRGQFEALAQRLQRLTGRRIGDAELDAALADATAVRALRRRLLAHRRERRLSGVESLQAIGAGMAMAPQGYLAALGPMVEALDRDASPRRQGPALLVISAEPLDGLALHAALESTDALVVAEDDAWGSRCAEALEDAPASASEAIFRRAWTAAVGPGVFPTQDRLGWAERAGLDPGVDAVVFYVPPSDHQFGWDYPALRRAFDQAGKPCLLVRRDVREAPDAVAEAARQFLSGVRRAA
jgi:benzoyl-CoA reductase/2-hydroxyglutaryl-CoA dehydratase subunit BcrC/BadD/HgdB